MTYSPELLRNLRTEHDVVVEDLQALLLECVVQGQSVEEARIREHLLHGAGRRIGVLGKAVRNVFQLFPPETLRPLERGTLEDVQINLHAFVMNLYGIFDNWAWAFMLRHNLDKQVGNRQKIGLFLKETAQYLPETLKTYLGSAVTKRWYEEYLKNYRDALAHRIPLYIPPATFTLEEGQLHKVAALAPSR